MSRQNFYDFVYSCFLELGADIFLDYFMLIIRDYVCTFSVIGVCGVRILWIYMAFFMHRNFTDIMVAHLISLSTTVLLIFVSLPIYTSSHKLQNH